MKPSSRRGATLVLVLLAIVVLAALVASVTSLLLSAHRSTQAATVRLQALYLAESGLDLALNELARAARHEPAWTDGEWTQDGDIHRLTELPAALMPYFPAGAQLDITVDPGTQSIRSIGRCPSPIGTPPVTRCLRGTPQTRDDGSIVLAHWQEE